MSREHDPQDPQRLGSALGPSLLFIYFMIGFVLGMSITIVGLSFIRPYLPLEADWVKGLVFAPLILGGLLGSRTARSGNRERLPLSQALLSALGLRRG